MEEGRGVEAGEIWGEILQAANILDRYNEMIGTMSAKKVVNVTQEW